MKIRPVGAELFHADRRKDGRTDGRTDGRDEPSSLFFCKSANAPKKQQGDLVRILIMYRCPVLQVLCL